MRLFHIVLFTIPKLLFVFGLNLFLYKTPLVLWQKPALRKHQQKCTAVSGCRTFSIVVTAVNETFFYSL